MPVSTVFQRILVASEIEEAAINVLAKWFPTYLREIESQLGLPVNRVPTPRNYTNRNKFDSLRGEEMPKIVVISPGLLNPPEKQGNGQYRALWRLGVGVATTGETESEASMMSKIYGSAVRKILLDKQSLGGGLGISEVIWIDEVYEDLPIPDQVQQYRAATIFFAVDVNNVVTARRGPSEPDMAPYEYGQVEEVIIDLEKDPIT